MHWTLLLLSFSCAVGYVFDCLDNCECDTEDEVVHCHNGDRTELALPHGSVYFSQSIPSKKINKVWIFFPGQRLRGFPVIGLTYNNIVRLPDEATLLSKFPDLKVIDVERNPNFDCDSLSDYDRVKIVSDCFKNVSEISRVPRIFRPTRECDLSCQAARHYAKLHEYVLHLWEILKQKYHDFDMDATLRQVQEFFKEVVRRVNQFSTDVQVNLKKATEKSDESKEVTPMPELRPVDTEA
ncbi:hypothetical protein ANCCAN_04761 [Ancylostoma caninum]|uniref:Leucine Rich repeat-containing domain protein n=1 Tax=Ancylostoma caninum TaxID=29170 RepID=A0A368H067_ANCCA|nr:hypothetical protein ANCCAN_04761 [Ancylostoma caninum]